MLQPALCLHTHGAMPDGFTPSGILFYIETAITAEATDTWFNGKVDVIRGLIHTGDVVRQSDVIAELEGQ